MKKYIFMALVACSIVISGCNNQAKQREIEKQRQEDSIRVAENVKKELAEKEAKERQEDSIRVAENVKKELAEKEAKERVERDKKEFVGTYEFTDNTNRTWVIILKDDKTATINEKGHESLYYGSWSDYPHKVPCLWFGLGEGKSPLVSFNSEDFYIGYAVITSDYIYAGDTYYKAKNPNMRLPIKKTK